MPLTPGLSQAVQEYPVAHYSTTKPGVASQTLNPFIGIEAGRTQTVALDSGYGVATASTLPQPITESVTPPPPDPE